MRLTWAQPEDLLPHELIQSQTEGKSPEAVAAIARRWETAGGQTTAPVSGAGPVPATPEVRALARELMDELGALAAASMAAEPNEFDQIMALAVPAPELPAPDLTGAAFADRVLGAWQGRAAGCLLGKPVEKIPRQGIEEILRATGRWPLSDYFTAKGLPPEVNERWPWNRRSAPTSLAENITSMPEDDDLNFPLLALSLLEESGPDFTTDDVATLWLNNLPGGRVFTAERAAYRNLLDAYSAPETATRNNPFREWIGALIRADVFGWVNPGDPVSAAKMAWTDARLSHTQNGIYGEMWAAALTSAALAVQCDAADKNELAAAIDQVLAVALSVVPRDSQLRQAAEFGAQVGRTCTDLSAGLDQIHEKYGSLHWVHVLNNVAAGTFALTFGRGDLGQTISAAVTAGWDTDSIGATVGSVVGGLQGASRLDQRWIAPMNGVVSTSLPGASQHSFTDLAARTVVLAQTIAKQN
ncbi:ADP-ribosylglycohydrolase family protein [Jonesiaceae bacterium BS-20]|uniref:ADP-ribosylglycohydrolase family protein n=1 Tax=Jonesiaceae bacterium BS-20 TaxID=3120821 RepID=A0AAU7DVH3_9MICO